VEAAVSDMDRLQAELEALQAGAEELEAQREPGTDLVLAQSPEAVAARMRETEERLRRQQVLVKAKVAEIRMVAEQQREELLAQMHAAERALEPVQAALREVGEQIKTIGLYLGTGERITQLADGAPAPVETPITIRQMILRMDEEVAAAAEEGGLDYRNMAEFDAWLLESPEHLAQVLPEPKGVVCFTPRDPKRSREETKRQLGPNPDATMYWLIRNGERLWRTTTDFEVPEKLLPGPTTFDDLFKSRHGGTIRPGSMEWEDAQERVEKAEVAYFRVQVILEGLLHRTPVFEPLSAQGMSFMDEAHHEAGRLAFILDAEPSLGDGGYESFPAWQHRLNAQLRPGLRIVGFFGGYSGGFASLSYREGRYGHPRLYPEGASKPESGVIYELEKVQGGRLGFKYERTDTVFRDWGRGYRPRDWESRGNAKVRASCRVDPTDDWILPYDLATEEELVRFLHARSERRHYVEMFPVIKAALRAKREERAMEEPFRVMLAGVLARENGVSVEQAREALPELVEWFKLTNRWHRPLLHKVQATGKGSDGLPEDRAQEMAAKAVRLITAEHARRVRIERSRPNADVVRLLREQGYRKWLEQVHADLPNAPVLVARRRADGKYLAVVPERSDEDVFAAVIVWGARKGLDELSRWQVLTKRQAASWQVLWAHERWQEWELDADRRKYLTDGEQQRLMDGLRGAIERGEADCEPGTPVLGFTVERRYGVRELCAYLLTEEPVMPNPERLLSEPGERGAVEVRSRGWVRRQDGSVDFYRPSFTTGWRHGGSRWTSTWRDRELQASLSGDPWPDGALVLWRDRPLIDTMRVRFQAYARAIAPRESLSQRSFELRRSIEGAWEAAWWEQQRQAFVAEYGKPELWDGQRKVIEDRMSRKFERLEAPVDGLEAPVDGLGELVAAYVERGKGDDLWMVSVRSALAAARTWGCVSEELELDESVLALSFPQLPQADEEEEAWGPFETDEEFDAEGSIEVVGELEAGS
jgi:hypothetical protein